MEWWYRFHIWVNLRPFAPARVILVTIPVFLLGLLPPFLLGKAGGSLAGAQDILVGFFIGITLIVIFHTILNLAGPKYAPRQGAETRRDGN